MVVVVVKEAGGGAGGLLFFSFFWQRQFVIFDRRRSCLADGRPHGRHPAGRRKRATISSATHHDLRDDIFTLFLSLFFVCFFGSSTF